MYRIKGLEKIHMIKIIIEINKGQEQDKILEIDRIIIIKIDKIINSIYKICMLCIMRK
jgi:hypothetical protein